MFRFIVFLVFFAMVAAKTFESPLTFDSWLRRYMPSVKPGSAEFHMRKALFEKAVEKVRAHNANPAHSYTITVDNKFAGMTKEERRRLLGYNKSVKQHTGVSSLKTSHNLDMKPVSELPASVDWRDSGIASPVKDQGHCGSCWAFAATAVMESHVAKESGFLFSLSPEQVAMCSPNPNKCGGTGGCNGATAEIAFDYAANSPGLVQEFAYPYYGYYGQNSACDASKQEEPVAYIGGFTQLGANNYTELMNAIATVGPIAVSVDASAWSAYEGGIFDGCDQEHPDIDHAVTLMGYGTCPKTGKDYWLIRNSWSPAWGEKGYIRLLRNTEEETRCGMDITPQDGSACDGDTTPVKACGTCGVLFDSSYPTGAGAFYADEHDRHP
jgi:cathepsin L